MMGSHIHQQVFTNHPSGCVSNDVVPIGELETSTLHPAMTTEPLPHAFKHISHRVPYCYFAQISPDKKKINGKTKDISLSNLYSQHFNCEQLVGFFFANTLYVFCFYFEPHISNTLTIFGILPFQVSLHMPQKNPPQVVHSWSVVNKGLKEKCPLFFHWFFFVQRDLGEITIGNPVGLCGKWAWMHGGGVLLSSLDEVQMSPTHRWELHCWIRIPKDDWWRPVGGCGSPSSLEDHPDILVGAQNRYGVDGAGIHVCHPVKTTYNLTEIS